MSREKTFLILTILILTTSWVFAESYKMAEGERTWRFPEDHGAHSEFKNEWWYFTGHLEGENRTYGFELTFFRFSNDQWPDNRNYDSEWFPEQIYLTHFTITDEYRHEFHKFEELNRGNMGLSGASSDTLHVWNGLYSASMSDGNIKISAKNPDVELSLYLEPKTGVILNGENGYSKKGPGKGEASYYYSMPGLMGRGSLRIGKDETEIISASAWMDREFFSIPESENRGWDWFAIQFENRSTLMIYTLRKENGEKSPYSSGTYVDPEGNKRILKADDFILTPVTFWRSSATETNYPVGWKVEVPDLGIRIRVKATLNDQELVLEKFLKMNYWEGRAEVTGSHRGNAYVELVGY